MPVDMMQHPPQSHGNIWDPQSSFGAPQHPMMGGVGGMGGMQIPPGMDMNSLMMMGGPMPYGMGGQVGAPGMMGPMGGHPQLSNPFDIPTRFTFPQQDFSPDGQQIITKFQLMDVYYIEKSPAVHQELQRAQKLNAEGNNQDCIQLLM